MNIKALFYNTAIRILYYLVRPVSFILNRTVTYPNFLIYVILRLEGYKKENAEIIVQQAVLESGHFESNLAIHGNNVFGMKMPRTRPTFANGTMQASEGTFATFETLVHAVLDRIEWDKWFSNIREDFRPRTMDAEEMAIRLSEIGYAEDGNYLDKILTTNSGLDFELPKYVYAFYTILALSIALVVHQTKK